MINTGLRHFILTFWLGLYFSTFCYAYNEGPRCQKALVLASEKKFDQAHSLLQDKSCPLTAKLVTWLTLKHGPANVSFIDYEHFIQNHKDWPWLETLKTKAEFHVKDQPAPKIIKWFKSHPPKTVQGLILYVKALQKLGHSKEACAKVRSFWKEKDFNASNEDKLLKELKSCLHHSDIKARASYLLKNRQGEAAARLIKYASVTDRKYIEVRLALQKNEDNADVLLRKSGLSSIQDPSLAKDYLTWLRKKQNSKLWTFFQKIENILKNNSEDFWKERFILAHEALETGDIHKSYRLASSHHLSPGLNFVEAEWFSGWIALRFMNKSEKALKHFLGLQSLVKTPISRARVFYWLGRTYEKLKNKPKAKEFYQKASHYKTTFYGQKALERLGFPLDNIQLEPLRFTKAQNQRFENRSFVKIIHLLAQAGMEQHVLSFSYVLAKTLPTITERQQVLALIYKLAPNYAVTIAQAIASHQSIPHPEAYPTLKMAYDKYENDLDPALVHAVIRKESAFIPKAVSSANAQGLMQLVPDTAKELALKMNIPWSENILTTQPLINVKLGSAYLKKQLKKYDGSLPKMLASYNAGPGTLGRWLERFPNPDTGEIDTLDWIEILPYSETRNYIQRVLENYIVYKAILHKS